MSTKLRYWAAGLATAAVGLVLVRVVSGLLAAQVAWQLAIYFTGAALALAGLMIILFGIRKGR
jgi:hypothetical protein